MKKLFPLIFFAAIVIVCLAQETLRISGYTAVHNIKSNYLFVVALKTQANYQVSAFDLYRNTETNIRLSSARIDGAIAASAGSLVTNRSIPHILSNRFDQLNIRDIGTFLGGIAQGDGATDDSPAFQLAYNLTTNRIGPIKLPAGTYKIFSKIRIPTTGASPTNRPTLIGESAATTIIDTSAITNDNAFECLATLDSQNQVHLMMKDLALFGPFYSSAFQFNQFTKTFADRADVPFKGAAIFLGASGVAGTGDSLGILTEFEGVKVTGYYIGLVMSNTIVMTTLRNCDFYRNAFRMCEFVHSDTLKITGGRYATVLVTNETSLAEHPFLFTFIGTGQVNPSGYADSGVQKIIEGIEAHGPFFYGDSALVSVRGCQFEFGQGQGATVFRGTNFGWCVMTNFGQYTFINSQFSQPLGDTNLNIFDMWNGIDSGQPAVTLINCKLPGGKDSSPTLNAQPRLFSIHGTNFAVPYWDGGSQDPLAGQNRETWLNTRFINTLAGTTNYVHTKRYGVDNHNQDALRRNGHRVQDLTFLTGVDKNNNPIGPTAYNYGAFRASTTHFGANFLGFGVAWYGINDIAPWYFEPFMPIANPDGTMPKNYRIYVPLLSTNNWTNQIIFSVASLGPGGPPLVDGVGTWGYGSKTTNVEWYVNTLTFANPPTGPVSARWGISGAVWATTNQIWTFKPYLEYW